ncbi:UNVERIFIED_CONTAM: hypothetical protein GTU68_040483 [Idotea baltica]|nr:hypothetical protein [Idotea baltica]
MADELGYYEPSHMGNPNIKTPHIDRLASEGIRFTQALAGAPVCGPTRCVLMTGKHSGHTSVRVNGGGTPLRKEEITIANLLKDAGYATGGFGKWGCGGRGSTGVPENHGFDRFVGYYDQVHAHSYYPPYLIDNSKELPLKGNKGLSDGETYSQYVIFDEAKKFLSKNKDRSFFCYMPFTPPHGIFDIPDTDPAWQLYKDKDWPEDARRYAAMVTMIDRQVGEVMEMLKDFGIDDNTLVFFCGDNGGNDYFKSKTFPRGFHGANKHPKTGVEFRGTKGTLYEGGLRIPMIAHWPAHIQPGQVSDLLWYFPDVLPTVCELAGIKPPADIDGMSIVPELIGDEAAGRKQTEHEYLYWEYGNQTAVRMQNWKAHRSNSKQAWKLYDLANDISETADVSAANGDILEKMAGFAAAAHTPAVEGTFASTDLHEKDRRAKFGGKQPPARGRNRKTARLKKDGLLPNASWKIARYSSQNKANRKFATNAIDGDPTTIWHSQFSGEVAKHPHELIIDLGSTHSIRGVRYLARQDGGWNGAIGKCEILVGQSTSDFEKPVATTTFKKIHESQEVVFKTVEGRFLMIRVLSEVNDGPWASIAEIGVIGQ